eukprot:3843281-Pyramimonas_sp.AAC.1
MRRRRPREENRAPHRAASPMHRRCGAILRPIYPDPIWEAQMGGRRYRGREGTGTRHTMPIQ